MPTMRTRKGIEVDSPFTHEQALTIVRKHVARRLLQSSFARDLVQLPELSADQMAWIHVLACQGEAGPFASVPELLERASKEYHEPKITFRSPRGQKVKLCWKGPSGHPVTVFLGRKNVGVFARRGAMRLTHEAPIGLVQALKDLAHDPVAFLAERGREEGECSFCRRALTDERSLEVGYGPICAQRYGLAWGENQKAEEVARG